MQQPGTPFILEVNPRIPQRLIRLEELANNLWYSWDRPTRALFSRLHPGLWNAVGHNPKAFLKRVDERRLVEAAEDPVFLSDYNRVLSAYDTYQMGPRRADGRERLNETDLVAYFCAEFGFHESLPIYSGGLGILAGDHCKAASDSRLPFVGVGLLYRQGYFTQTIDGEGNQHARYVDSNFDDLPIVPVTRADGSELRVTVDVQERRVTVKVWQARVGHVTLYLLDTDLAENAEIDRDIGHRLYGGDRATRIMQEIVLGVGGVRALDALGLNPAVWHINEGHAAFMVLERMREIMLRGPDFATALEAVAVSTIFTTHTAVGAGHDRFDAATVLDYCSGFLRESGISDEALLALGRMPDSDDFNMTALAARGSRFQNGVSRIHGEVSARVLSQLWPEIPPQENPVAYITNGVHVPTFLAPEMAYLFERFAGAGWMRLPGGEHGDVGGIPDHLFWSTHQHLKAQMLHLVRHRIRVQHFRNQGSEAHLDRLLRFANPDNPNVLTIGFGRRFATYKRATLLFNDLECLHQIVSDPQRPVVFIFAGKAHPADTPGQAFIRRVAEVARTPEFVGRILLVEDYDMHFARRLVSGVDVWLNNPAYPMEASGTSGMKAAINGVVNLSMLDGWWGEAYDGSNGWAIKPMSAELAAETRDREEARTLYEVLQDHVVPLYYRRGDVGHPAEWIRMAKHSIATILPRFNAHRMTTEYVTQFYLPAMRQGRRFARDEFTVAAAVAAWKARVRAAWPGFAMRRTDDMKRRIRFGDSVHIEIGVQLNGLRAEDIIVELLVTQGAGELRHERRRSHTFAPYGEVDADGEQRFVMELTPKLCGRLGCRIRAYPSHPALTHRFEMGLMAWI
ncbi:MAG TPA: alpha-glucan family phosphorylase [Burkholderiales bacterium]|nr:alpha-glucan family phosphorylase [Burkholderiales bacterium]